MVEEKKIIRQKKMITENSMKIIIFLMLISFRNSYVFINRDAFTGCKEIDFFENIKMFRFYKIDFSLACSSFVNCARDPEQSRIDCLDLFAREMDLICKSYPDYRLVKIRYCLKLSEKNQVLAQKLDNQKFEEVLESYKIAIGFASLVHIVGFPIRIFFNLLKMIFLRF